VWVVPTDEELMIARHTQRLIAQADAQPRRQRRRPRETADAA
jgi:hypothetical protein